MRHFFSCKIYMQFFFFEKTTTFRNTIRLDIIFQIYVIWDWCFKCLIASFSLLLVRHKMYWLASLYFECRAFLTAFNRSGVKVVYVQWAPYPCCVLFKYFFVGYRITLMKQYIIIFSPNFLENVIKTEKVKYLYTTTPSHLFQIKMLT